MADIFISYSSRDREKAEQLTELLASAGLSVWIDQAGIDVSTSWSKEIVQAINDCRAFLVLLSPASLASHNVIKEVSLASEKRKKILPLELEPVTLTEDFEYQLAGIQRAPMTSIDAIIRALGRLGLDATQAPSMTIVRETDSRKSLMILPFEDMSPTGDNGWFADGIVSEMITALSNVKALRVADARVTKEFKAYNGQLATYARAMNIRYFVQGDVRKFGDKIKITSRLLDIESGDSLWQDSMKGTMDDIFDIQEKVAENVVEGLKVHLAADERKKLTERGTENAEAYELVLRAGEYFSRQTKEGRQLTVQLTREAIKLDPGFANAYQLQAIALTELYRSYDSSTALLDDAESLCDQALRLKPDLYGVYHPLMQVYMHRGQLDRAEQIGKEFVRKAPESNNSYASLGFFYCVTEQYAKAIAPLEEAVRLNPDDRVSLSNLVSSCFLTNEMEQCARWATVGLPVEQRYLKLHPDAENSRVNYAQLLFFSGRTDDARKEALQLKDLKDGGALHNTAVLFANLGDKHEALATSRKAIAAGYRNVRQLNGFLVEEFDGIAQLAGAPEYQELKEIVEQIAAEAKTNG